MAGSGLSGGTLSGDDITEDMPKAGYLLGLNYYRESLERKADKFIKEVTFAFTVKRGDLYG